MNRAENGQVGKEALDNVRKVWAMVRVKKMTQFQRRGYICYWGRVHLKAMSEVWERWHGWKAI